ncbi:MAG TPA: methyltransferase [Bacteroidia bacterium]|jgi:hypothetical protein|nr:methyltransferase [Bacteroidia bacterium]
MPRPDKDQIKISFDDELNKEPESTESDTPLYDNLMAFLEEMNQDIDKQNKKLQAMLDELQKDWTEEEKLQISNPKEYERLQKLKQTEIKKEEPMSKLTEEAIEVLKNSTIDNNIVRLPEGQLERKVYLEVKKYLEILGGKWKGGNTQGFVYNEEYTSELRSLLDKICGGEKVNPKKQYQYFPTPKEICEQLIKLAGLKKDHLVLEPSAGQGAIMDVILDKFPNIQLFCCEKMSTNQIILNKKYGNKDNIGLMHPLNDDFLEFDELTKFDRIIMNPPFQNNQDCSHIQKAYSCLAKNGKIVAISSKHWKLSKNKKETEFREWLDEVGAEIKEIPAGAFKDSSTNIETLIIIIDKK